MARMSQKAQMHEAIERLRARLEGESKLRDPAATVVETFAKTKEALSPKARKALKALEAALLETSRCSCGRFPSYSRTLRGGICETCMSS